MNPTDRYRQICTQTAQWLAKQPKRPDYRIEILQTRDPDGSLFYVIDIETPSHVCKININTPIFAPTVSSASKPPDLAAKQPTTAGTTAGATLKTEKSASGCKNSPNRYFQTAFEAV